MPFTQNSLWAHSNGDYFFSAPVEGKSLMVDIDPIGITMDAYWVGDYHSHIEVGSDTFNQIDVDAHKAEGATKPGYTGYLINSDHRICYNTGIQFAYRIY